MKTFQKSLLLCLTVLSSNLSIIATEPKKPKISIECFASIIQCEVMFRVFAVISNPEILARLSAQEAALLTKNYDLALEQINKLCPTELSGLVTNSNGFPLIFDSKFQQALNRFVPPLQLVEVEAYYAQLKQRENLEHRYKGLFGQYPDKDRSTQSLEDLFKAVDAVVANL